MAEKVQRLSKSNDIVDEGQVLPDKIHFSRLVNTGDYENLRFGGDFKIPENMTGKEALDAVMAFVKEEVETYLKETDKRDLTGYASDRIERFQTEIANFREILADVDDKEAEKKKELRARIVHGFNPILKTLKDLVNRINYSIGSVFEAVDTLLENSGYTLEDLDIGHFDFFLKRFRAIVLDDDYEVRKIQKTEDEETEDEDPEDEDWTDD